MSDNPTTTPGRELIVPGSGELIQLDADTETLAEAVVQITARIAEIKDNVLGTIDSELLARLDRRRKYTVRTDLKDGVQFELKSTSPDAGTEAYDPVLLEKELAGLVDRKVIDAEAAAEALKRTITVTFQVPFGHELDPLAERLKQVPKIADVPVTVLSATVGRTQLLPGITRLRKGDGCKAAMDRAQLPKQEPKRTVKIKKLTVEGAKA